jgi:hypothetical protein
VQKGLEVQHPSQSLCEVKALTPSKIAGMGEFRNSNDFTATSGDAMARSPMFVSFCNHHEASQ